MWIEFVLLFETLIYIPSIWLPPPSSFPLQWSSMSHNWISIPPFYFAWKTHIIVINSTRFSTVPALICRRLHYVPRSCMHVTHTDVIMLGWFISNFSWNIPVSDQDVGHASFISWSVKTKSLAQTSQPYNDFIKSPCCCFGGNALIIASAIFWLNSSSHVCVSMSQNSREGSGSSMLQSWSWSPSSSSEGRVLSLL